MPEVTLYRLRPRGPMHAGVRGIGVEGVTPFPSAATVFSGWCWAVRRLAGVEALEGVLAGMQEDEPPLLLAAPMPWIGDVLLMPRPWLPATSAPEAIGDAPRDKRGKRYRWIAEDLWFRLVAGDALADAFEDDNAFQQDLTIWATGDAGRFLAQRLRAIGEAMAPDAPHGRAGAFWRVGTAPHVTVDRHSGAGSIFQRGGTWFAPGTDLALPVIWRDDTTRDVAERALGLLGDTGVGGERSAGHGQFDIAGSETRRWPDLAGGGALVTLSGYCPTREEARGGVFERPASYELERSQGWVEQSTHRYRARLVSAGSVLRALPGRGVYGGLVEVTPATFTAHRVYRYGFAFPLPVALPQGGEGDR
jgi:CRISPR-associated protein Csm4